MPMPLPPFYRFVKYELRYRHSDGQLLLATHEERRLVGKMHEAHKKGDTTRFNFLTGKLREQRSDRMGMVP